MLTDNANTYAYNAESEIKSAAGVTYTYDGDGNRLEKSSGKIYWYGAGTEILDESNSSGTFTNEYVFFGGKRVAMRNVSSGTIYYYEEDMLGTSRTMVQAGQTSVCYDADFYPFGGERDITSSCAQNYKFEGKERDTETGNDDFGARYYTSRLGRWLSADWSSVPAPVPYANLTNPQTLNLYAMVSDNPETFADLDGHCGHQTMAGAPTAMQPCDNPGENTHADQGEGSGNSGIAPVDCSSASCEEVSSQTTQVEAQNTANDNTKEGNTTVGALEKTMTNEVGSLSTPKKGNPDVLGDAKDALANTLINNANLDNPAKVAPATGTASTQDAQIMRDAATNRANGGADPVEGRTQFGTTHNPSIQSRSAMNHLKGAAGRETVYEKFGPFRDSVSRRPTWIVIYNDPGH